MMPIFKVSFADFRRIHSELVKPVDNASESALHRMLWFETTKSIWIYFDSYYTQIQKIAIENSKEFDDVDDFKTKFLATSIELVEQAPELKRLETLLEHQHFTHSHLQELPEFEKIMGLTSDKKQILSENDNR